MDRSFEDMILEKLYGLLEPAEEARFQRLLEASPDNRALWAAAQAWPQKLAAAAKSEHPNVTFTPPNERKTVSPASEPERRARRVVARAAAIAAALIAVLVPLGVFGVSYLRNASAVERADARLAEANAALAQANAKTQAAREAAQREFNAASERFAQLEQARDLALAAVRQKYADKELSVSITGPERVQPGALNEYQVRTLDRNRADAPAKVEVAVRDAAGTEVFRLPPTVTNEPLSVRLPVSVWANVKPDAELFLDVVAIDDAGGKSTLAEKLALARPVYVTQLVTDKPMYKPGETVYFRSLTLDRATLLPPADDQTIVYKLTDPSGAEVFQLAGVNRLEIPAAAGAKPMLGPDGKPLRGVGGSSHKLGDDLPGGEYTLSVSKRDRDTEVLLDKRKLIVNKYVQDQLQKKLEFDAKTYGSGDTVQVKADGKRATGEPLANTPVSVRVTVAGEEVKVTAPATADGAGTVRLKFELPKELKSEDASVTVTFRDPAAVEAITRPVPLVATKLDVQFFPEGGDLIAGVPNRVYVAVRTPRGKPADLTGFVTDNAGLKVAVRTLTDADLPGVNQGLGVFEVTPVAGKPLELKIDKPLGIVGKFPLPEAKADGLTLSVLDGVTRGNEPIRVTLGTPKGERKLIVGAYCRGRLIDHQRATAAAGKPAEVVFKPDATAGGVIRVTVFEEQGNALKAVAERLAFRHPGRYVALSATPTKARYNPGEEVELGLKATTEAGAAVPAILNVSVVQRSVLAMADDKTERALPAHVFLAGEVKTPDELEHADFLVGPHPKAAATVDLLLGTQGWRRFAEVSPREFEAREPAAGPRLLAAIGQKSKAPVEVLALETARVRTDFQVRLETTASERDAAGKANERMQAAPAVSPEQASAVAAVSAARAERSDADRRLTQARENVRLTLVLGTLGLGALVVIGGLAWIVASVTATRSGGKSWVLGTAVALGGVAAVGLVAISMIGQQANKTFTRVGATLPGATDAPAMAMAEAKKAELPAPLPGEGRGRFFGALEHVPGLDGPRPEGMRGDAGEPAGPPGMPGGIGGMRFGHPGGPVPGMAPPGAPKPAAMPVPPPAPMAAAPEPAAPLMEEEHAGAKPVPGDKALKDAQEKLAEVEKADNDLAKAAPRGLAVAKPAAPARRANNFALRRQIQDRLRAPAGRPGPADGPVAAEMDMDMLADGLLAGDRRKEMAKKKQEAVAPPAPFSVREYAHMPAGALDGLRTDFTETVYWHPAKVLDGNGEGRANFKLAGDIGQYRVLVVAHTLDGRIGSFVTDLESRKPFSIDPKLPVEISQSDRIDVPVRVVNDSPTERNVKVVLEPRGLALDGQATGSKSLRSRGADLIDTLLLEPDQRTRRLYRFVPSGTGEASLTVSGESSDPPASPDAVRRTVKVVAEGFPQSGSQAGQLLASQDVQLTLPPTWVPGSLTLTASIFPSSLSELQKGLEGMLTEPYGCFEQTSNGNYPNVMILDYLSTTDQASPELSARARRLLESGYQRLTSFECQVPDGRRGYDWFGGSVPAHQALTAFGLMQFLDMSRYQQVDPAMIQRTRDYLLGQRDGKGGFLRNPRHLDAFGGAPEHITNAYIVWALTESELEGGQKSDLEKEITALTARASNDPYYLAVVANVLLNRNRAEEAVALLDKVAAAQKADGAIEGAETSITSSSGRYLHIETTSLAVLALLKANRPDKFAPHVKRGAEWIGKQRDGRGAFGATQSTVLALKALIGHAKANQRPAEDGTLAVFLGDKPIGSRAFTKADGDTITLPLLNAEKELKPGKNVLTLKLSTKAGYPFTFAWTARTLTPASAEGTPVRLATLMPKSDLVEGQTATLDVAVTNTSDKSLGMVTAIVGLPAGLKVPEDMKQLKRLTELPADGSAPRLSYFEIRGRELVLYWRTMKPKQVVEFPLELIADVPGEFRGPASRAYVYYDADVKHWVEPVGVRIAPAK